MTIKAEDYLGYLHQLRVCSQKPNKLVTCAFLALSDEPTLTAIAARAIAYLEVISISIFVRKQTRFYVGTTLTQIYITLTLTLILALTLTLALHFTLTLILGCTRGE